MPIAYETVASSLKAAFPDADITIEDTRGNGDYYKVSITDASFAGKNRVAQHRMVYEALGGAMDGALHALALETHVK